MRFTGIRLLLVFVATNTIMILMLVPSMTSKHPWLAHVLPGQFQAGGNYSGYWVFFALVLLVDAITVLAVALSVLLPALRESTVVDLERIGRRLVNRPGVSEETRALLLEEASAKLADARYQMFVGRTILIIGAVFLVMAFSSVTLSFVRALPNETMFIEQCIEQKDVCGPGQYPREVANKHVKLRDIRRFSLDQITRAALFGAPDVYDWHIGVFTNNPRNALFSNFVFAFRILFGVILLLTLVSLRLPAARRKEEKAPSLRDTPLAETAELSG